MAIKLEITVNDDCPYDEIAKAFEAQMAALGFVRGSNGVSTQAIVAAKDIFDPNAYKTPAGDAELRAAITEASHAMVEKGASAIAGFAGSGEPLKHTGSASGSVAWAGPGENLPLLTEMDGDRKRGDHSPGRKRRTAAEVEEDRLYFSSKVRAASGSAAPVHPEILAMVQGPIAEPVAAEELQSGVEAVTLGVSTGEERVNPEDAEQDAADEAAETAQRPAGPPTLEDLRATVALYIDKFGHAASVKNMKTIIGCAVADCPVEEISNAIAKVKMALSGSTVITPVDPSTGKANEPETAEMFPEPVTASPAEVVEAIKAYARKFDGTDTDQDAMVVTKEDLPKVFSATFGKGVTGMGSLPDKKPETLGKILAAIKAATELNTFGRTAKS